MTDSNKKAYELLVHKALKVGFENLSLNERNQLRDLHGEYEDQKHQSSIPDERFGAVQ